MLDLFRWLRRDKTETRGQLADPEEWLLELFGAVPTTAGISVGPASAMRVPAVANAVGLISSTIGTLPAKVFRRAADGGKEPDRAHPHYALVHRDANPWTSAGKLREQLTIDALLRGHGVAYANRVGGKVRELIRLQPESVKVEIDDRTAEPSFEVTLAGGGQKLYRFDEIIYIPSISIDGVSGIAPIQMAREAIAILLVMERYVAKLMGTGGRPSGTLRFPQRLGAETAKRIRASWQAATSGDNAGGTAVLEEGGEFQPLAFSSVDNQFTETRAQQIAEVARAFRINPVLIGDNARATWSNSEQFFDQFLKLTLLPWLRTWESAYSRVLLSEQERDEFSIEFVVDDLLRADTATRFEAYAKGRAAGVLTSNDCRRMENLPALPGGDTLNNPFTTTTTTTTGPAK